MRTFAALLLIGCHEIKAFEVPPSPPEEAKSAIVAFESGEDVDLFALELGGADPLTRPFTAADDAVITLLYLPHDLPSMEILPGKLEPARSPPLRSLPQPIAAFRTVEGSDPLHWELAFEPSDRVAAFRLPGYSIEDCAEIGGCFLDPEAAERVDCSVPCPIRPPAPPAEAMLPELPIFEPCPRGWIARTAESLVLCEPNDLASLCPDGPWADGLPADAVLIDPAQTSLADAIAAAPANAVLALGKGVHFGGVRVDRELAIIGACAAETIIEVPTGTVGISALANTSISGVTIRGGNSAIVIGASRISVEDSVLENSVGPALSAANADVALLRTAVRASSGISAFRSTVTADRMLLFGVTRSFDLIESTAHLEHVLVEDGADRAVLAQTSTVAILDLAVLGNSSSGVETADSNVTMSRAALYDMGSIALWIRGRGTFIGDDLSISRGRITGLEVALNGTAVVHRFAGSEIDGEGIHITSQTRATIEDVTIERDGATPDPFGLQCAFDVRRDGQVTARRIHLERILRQGACAYDSSRVVLEDLTALDVGDHGIYVFQEASMQVSRALIDGAAEGAVAFLTTQMTLSDLTVRNMHGNVRYVPPEMLGFPKGRGLYNNAMAQVSVFGFEVSGCADAGVDLSGKTSVTITNGLITDNQIGARLTFDPEDLLQLVSVRGNRDNFVSN
jgi:hypothetical protein